MIYRRTKLLFPSRAQIHDLFNTLYYAIHNIMTSVIERNTEEEYHIMHSERCGTFSIIVRRNVLFARDTDQHTASNRSIHYLAV